MAKDHLPRLRAEPLTTPFHLVLLEPEIPQNTGNIGRLSAALQCPLHLIRPLGFRIDEKAVRRAGLDYWPLVELYEYDSFDDFVKTAHPSRLCFFTAVATRSYLDAAFSPGDALVFGKESVGLPLPLIEAHPDNCFAIPTVGGVRSLNLANSVSIVAYEAMRQVGTFERTFLG
ncbi:MAG: tRNA (cytidine(34)-2'-O)-methyltransferase [Myxococcota bacterium]